jgi:D-glycero-D-manno-heptose 1,7-bisphosphate phosphatase
VNDRRAVFLDRDGTVIEDAHYASSADQVRIVPGAAEALRALRDDGFLLAVVSNQSGIGRGLITPEQAAEVHERFVAELKRRNVRLDAVRYCPHSPDEGCVCRKPAPGLILAAAAELGADPSSSFMVGDTASDIAAGKAAGCRTIAIGARGETGADWTVSSWVEVVDIARAGREPA